MIMKKLFIACAVVLAAVSCAQKPAEPVKKDMAIQLYSVRSLIGKPELYQQNQARVFKAIADAGFTAVEAASYNNGKFYGVAPEQYKADLEAAGLKSFSSHTGHNLSLEEVESGDFTESLNWWKEAIPAHKAAGMSVICIPSLRMPKTLAELQLVCDYFNAVGKLCADEGILFGYHSHSFEYEKIEDQVMFDYMLQHTDPQYVFFEMDVYWAVYGRVSPVDYFKTYPGRFKVLHIKDAKEIGQSGFVGFDAIFNNFDVAGTKAYVVEIERYSYEDVLQSMKESADYLLAADFVKPSYAE